MIGKRDGRKLGDIAFCQHGQRVCEVLQKDSRQYQELHRERAQPLGTNLMTGLTINITSKACWTPLDIHLHSSFSLSDSRAEWGSVPNEWRFDTNSRGCSWYYMSCYIATAIQVTHGSGWKRGTVASQTHGTWRQSRSTVGMYPGK